jgi:hypothetical protein
MGFYKEATMDRETRSKLAVGLMLILLGGCFLAFQLVPSLKYTLVITYSWPLIVVGVGVFLLSLGLILRAPGMAVPACIVGGIGGILYWQNLTGLWESWAYLWTLIPGFVGIGILLSGFLGGELRSSLREGLRLVLISIILFVLFWVFLSRSGLGWEYWPIILIIFGLWTLVEGFWRGKRR